MIVGDVTLTTVSPEYVQSLRKLADKYEDAVRLAGLSQHSKETTVRNQAYGKVYEARKAFLAALGSEDAA